MQSLSLNPSQGSTAWDSGRGAHTSAASTQEQHPDSNQYSNYDPNRDSTAQPMSAWQSYGYYDPSTYGYNEYGEYYDKNAYGSEAGDDWDQLGIAAEPECTQHPENELSKAASDKKPPKQRRPSEQALCSQYQICGRYMLHPHNEEQRQEHNSECQARHDRLGALRHSQGVDCCVCLERVLDKPTAAERKFGLLSCEHAFCLGCIRGWRSHHEGGADTDTALRTCPLCRAPCWFVTPSSIWPANQEDKDRIVAGYKAKLGSIDCRHWNFGENTCPFGTSCFYRHIYPDGRPQEAVLRKYGNSEGEVKILQPVRLSDFIQVSSQRHPLRGIR
ncbi:TPA: hypothetical protein ACH3X1_012157 [Trebouxia sp. C0004]